MVLRSLAWNTGGDYLVDFRSTDGLGIRSLKSCLFFDPVTGKIRYAYHVLTVEGADETPDDEIMRLARTGATERGNEPARLDAMLIDSKSLLIGSSSRRGITGYRVDISSRMLIPDHDPEKTT